MISRIKSDLVDILKKGSTPLGTNTLGLVNNYILTHQEYLMEIKCEIKYFLKEDHVLMVVYCIDNVLSKKTLSKMINDVFSDERVRTNTLNKIIW